MSLEDRLKEMIAPTASKWPYRVIQIKPNKKLDTEIYTLSGREEDIAANGSLFLALYDLAAQEKIDFEEWWQQWENGFPLLTERVETNYPLASWHKTDTRPRYREWQKAATNNTGTRINYRVIEYWDNRSDESDSVIFSGTDLQIINQIIQFKWQKSNQSSVGIPGKNSKPPLKGWPALILNFIESNDKVRRKPDGTPRRQVTGQKIIRTVGFTDDRAIADLGFAEFVSSADIRRWATKIQEQFASPPYRWQKGRECLSYSGHLARLQGLEGYAFVRSASQGKDLFARLLKIFDYTPDRTGFHFSANEEPELAFPENPPDFQLLGKNWDADAERAIAEVVFDNAVLALPKLSSPIPLVKGTKITYNA